jgi:hypothetical protein
VSIIQEALKKVGNSDSREPGNPPALPASGPAADKIRGAALTQKNAPGARIVYYAATGLFLLLLAGIVVRVSYLPARAQNAAVAPRKIEPMLPTIERREEPPAPKRAKENIGGFVLNGIMYLVDGPRAIINDIIVGEGETVGGAKVSKIKKDQVILDYNDSEVELNINK